MNIEVCIGNSCQSKACDIIRGLHQLIKAYRLEDEVTLSAAYCMGHCAKQGVAIRIDDDMTMDVSKENLAMVFEQYILRQPVGV